MNDKIKLTIKNKENLGQEFKGCRFLDKTSLQLFEYNKSGFTEMVDLSVENIPKFDDPEKVYWLNLHGIHDAKEVTVIGEKLGLHALVIEDILDTTQMPKMQEFENYMFVTIKSVLPEDENDDLEVEQISFILGSNFVASFQEKKGDHFGSIRQHIREDYGIIRENNADYLLFLLLEAIFDNYFETFNQIDAAVGELSGFDMSKDPSPKIINDIEEYRIKVNKIKKSLLPLKDSLSKIERVNPALIAASHLKYYYDLKDQCQQLIENFDQESFQLGSNINLYFSVQGHRMNQVMKTLTVVSVVFIPLTFIAGLYGMNFRYMPELQWSWGYYLVLSIMLVVFIGMMVVFKIKKWF